MDLRALARGLLSGRAPRARELDYASRALTSIEINGTYYSTFKPASWAKWRQETPDGFVFSIKGSRYCTNRRVLSEAGEAVGRFVNQGFAELGDRLGPINWQLAAGKRFEAEDIEGFLKLLPRDVRGLPLRHALVVRHPSFQDPDFHALARRYGVAITLADDDTIPRIEEATADFTDARLMRTREDVPTGYDEAGLDHWAERARDWARRGDVFLYVISGAKLRAPAAAQALIRRLEEPPPVRKKRSAAKPAIGQSARRRGATSARDRGKS